jgi:hypothetical protein
MERAYDDSADVFVTAGAEAGPSVVVPRRFGSPTPEQRLMAAVLEDAIHELQLRQRLGGGAWANWTTSAVHRRSARETVTWFQSRDRWWPYSFENICDGLGLDAPSIRRRLGVGVA